MVLLKKNIIVLSEETGLPLEGAHILSSDNINTITDQNGRATVQTRFALNTIKITYIGYYTQEIPFVSLDDVVYLQNKTESLDEVVIIATKPKPKPKPKPNPPEKKKSSWWLYSSIAAVVLGVLVASSEKKPPTRKVKM